MIYQEPVVKEFLGVFLYADAQYILDLNSTDCPGFKPDSTFNIYVDSAHEGRVEMCDSGPLVEGSTLTISCKGDDTSYLWRLQKITFGSFSCDPGDQPYVFDMDINPSMAQECHVIHLILSVPGEKPMDTCAEEA